MSLDPLSNESLRRLHRGVIAGADAVRALLERALEAGVELRNGVDRRSAPRTAQLRWVGHDRVRLAAPNIRAGAQPQIYLHFDLGPSRFFFAAPPLGGGADELLDLELPTAIYEAERRDLSRTRFEDGGVAPRVRLRELDAGATVDARLVDLSYQGIGVTLAETDARMLGDVVSVEFLDGARKGERAFGAVRHRRPGGSGPGTTRLGIEVSEVAPAAPFPVEQRERILPGGVGRRAWRKLALAGELARSLPRRKRRSTREVEQDQAKLELVSYRNDRGHEIRGLLDRAGSGKGGTAVVIPPAWGRTKETFLPLARAIVAAFEAQGEPVAVLRYDGTNRRGESYIDAECRAPGDEYLRFEFSQAVRDIEASLDFLEARADVAPERIVLVTFSLGAIEGRRAIARDAGRRVDGWVSVVGMVDLQSGLRTVSGGVDFAFGLERGVEFGRHELVGVVADMDFTGRDALAHDLVYLEDAKRDMATIEVPVTWIHGRHDAWMELERVRALLAAGPGRDRRLIEIAAGHQMRSSSEALETFQLVGTEVVRMALGRASEPVLPDLDALDLRTRAERSRCPLPVLDASGFWEDYLLGRDRRLGFELLSATSAYRDFMALQIERLALARGEHVVDLGSGTGDFAMQLARANVPSGVRVTQVDLVPGALARGRRRIEGALGAPPFALAQVAANLELHGWSIPLASASADAVLASLFLSYVEDPKRVLGAMCDLLRPGGRLVISSMRRDADISRIYVESFAELPPDRRRAHFGAHADDLDRIQRVFLNDAARLLQLEELGRFRFFDGDELAALCREVGLEVDEVDASFGSPPQAVVVLARRPER